MNDHVTVAARKLLQALGKVDEGSWIAMGGIADEVSGSMHDLRRAFVVDHDARAPSALASLLRWCAERPDEYGPGFWCRLPPLKAGLPDRGFVTNARALLAIDDASGVEGQEGLSSQLPNMTAAVAPASLAKFDREAESATQKWKRTAADLSGSHLKFLIRGRQDRGGVLLSAELVRTWVLPAARITGGEITIARRGPLEPVQFRGAGWRAYVMPMRWDHDLVGEEVGQL